MVSGDPQNTSRKPSGKKGKRLSQKEQSERFRETARTLEVDESGEAFESALRRIIPTSGQDHEEKAE